MEYLDGEFTANDTYYSIRPIDHISLLLLSLLPSCTLIFQFLRISGNTCHYRFRPILACYFFTKQSNILNNIKGKGQATIH